MKKGWNLLHQMAADGNLEIVRHLIEDNHFDRRDKTDNELTAPQLAAINGHEEVVRWFLSAGFDLEEKSDGMTLLHCAAVSNNVNLVRLLVNEMNADIKSKTDNGWTVLHLAAESGIPEIVQLFVEEMKVDLYEKNNDGKTAADIAIHPDIQRYLLKKMNFYKNEDT